MSDHFWKELPSFDNFDESFEQKHYHDFDATWYIFIADIQGSTAAIKEGRYKDVNLIGALCIIAVLNACKEMDIPFVFGGDGASILVPKRCFNQTKQALLATQQRSLEHFDIHLRVGAVQIAQLYHLGSSLQVAKYKVSKDYSQALFKGGGMTEADRLVKESPQYRFKAPNEKLDVDFDGLECRWRDILSPKDETISLLVHAKDAQIYQEVLHFINTHLGQKEERHPIQAHSLNLSFSLNELSHEARAKHRGFKKYLFLLKIFLLNLLGWCFMRFDITTDGTRWSAYKEQIHLTTDAEKFDDMLRMVSAVNFSDRLILQEFLDTAYKEGKIFYGLHVSNRALMTCLVFERMGAQVHFVDAAEGGYAMAAIGLKQQLKKK